jgi:hypothetical protein
MKEEGMGYDIFYVCPINYFTLKEADDKKSNSDSTNFKYFRGQERLIDKRSCEDYLSVCDFNSYVKRYRVV